MPPMMPMISMIQKGNSGGQSGQKCPSADCTAQRSQMGWSQ
jgi:hypothetical protein